MEEQMRDCLQGRGVGLVSRQLELLSWKEWVVDNAFLQCSLVRLPCNCHE
jgi:hypothetical protein